MTFCGEECFQSNDPNFSEEKLCRERDIEKEEPNPDEQEIKSDEHFHPIFCGGGLGLDDISGPFFSLEPLKEGDEEYLKLCRFSKLGIEKYNSDNNTNYELVKYVKGKTSLCAGLNYYLTFEAKEAADCAPTTFRATVYEGIRDRDGAEVIKVSSVRMKSRTSEEDVEANNRMVLVNSKGEGFSKIRWKKLRVGDVVKFHKDEYFPAHLLLLSSSYPDGISYVETMKLDEETNLKLKHALDVIATMRDEKFFDQFKEVIKCQDPNEDLNSFFGNLYYDGQRYPLSLQQLLLRDSKLLNTDYVYGVVLFTGHDTKVMQNATDPPSKRSMIKKRMDRIGYFLYSTLILTSFIGSVFFWSQNYAR